jgi:hypothetical protein
MFSCLVSFADSWSRCSASNQPAVTFTSLKTVMRRACLSPQDQVKCASFERAHPQLKEYLNTCNPKLKSEMTVECAPAVAQGAGIAATAVIIGWQGLVVAGGAYAAYKLATDFLGEDQKCFEDLKGKRDRIKKFNEAMPDPRFVVSDNETFLKNVTCSQLHRSLTAKWRSFLVENKSTPEVYLTRKFDNGVVTEGWFNPQMTPEVMNKYKQLISNHRCLDPEIVASLICSGATGVGAMAGGVAGLGVKAGLQARLADFLSKAELSKSILPVASSAVRSLGAADAAQVKAITTRQATERANAQFQEEFDRRAALAKIAEPSPHKAARSGFSIKSYEDYQKYIPTDKSDLSRLPLEFGRVHLLFKPPFVLSQIRSMC